MSVCGKTGAQNSVRAAHLYRNHQSRPHGA
jgi:hypothetical protein